MTCHAIDEPQAKAILKILVEECGYTVDPDRAAEFVRSIVKDDPPCREYRFCGALGFGGKFRNNGNFSNTPYVDCYQEDMNPRRAAMITRANQRLATLFKGE